MGDFFAVLYLAVFLAAGIFAAHRLLPDEGPALAIPLGCGAGCALLAALPAVFAVGLGFTLPAVLLGGALALALAVILWLRRPGWQRLSADALPLIACVVPVFLLCCWLLGTHVLREEGGAYYTGQSCYGDLALHLAFIKNIAETGTFPPIFPLLAGDRPIGYPFLCETVSSALLVLGAGLKTAYILPLLPALISVFGMGWQLARRILGRAGKASLTFWLFFMGSGFGFCYFLESPEKFASIFTAFYNTPTNYTEENILWVNPIVDLLIPQRATLFGWCVLFPALYLLWRFAMEGETRLWLGLALLVLPLPLLQAHSALALVLCCLICGIYCLIYRPHTRKALLPWLELAVLCGAVWLCTAWGSVFSHAVEGEKMLRLHFNWSNGSDDGTLTDNYFWFYIKNIGLVYLLLIPAFFHAPKRQRWFYGGGLAILALAEFVEFQTNNYDNNKLLFIWHLLGCILVAGLVWDVLAKIRPALPRVLLAACFCFLCTFGSVLTVGRELVSNYCQWTADDIAVAAFADEETDPHALFLTDDSHLQPVNCLAGRQILCGSGTFVYYHGMAYADEYNAMHTLYEAPDEQTLADWEVDYVLFGPSVYANFAADEGWYQARYPLVYENASYRVYQVR